MSALREAAGQRARPAVLRPLRRGLAPCMLALLAACATTASSGSIPSEAPQAPRTSFRDGDDRLSVSMRALSAQLHEAGLRADRHEYRGFLTAGARSTHALRIPPRTCQTLVAIASRGVHDMDAAVYSPAGEMLAADSQPDAHPTIQVCSGDEAAALYYVVHIYEGAGAYLMVPFEGPPGRLEAGARLLGGRPAIARLGRQQADNLDRVAAFRDGVLRRGFEAHGSPLPMPLSRNQRMRVALPVQPGACYTAGAFALDGIGDVNLRVLDEEGVEVGRDESPERDASTQFCADRRAEYTTEVHASLGEGQALLEIFRVEAAAIGGHSGLWLGERPVVRAATMPLPEARGAVAAEAGRDGFRRPRLIHEGYLATGEVAHAQLALGAKRCARVHAVGGRGVRALALEARDEEGNMLTSTRGGAQTTYVHVCAKKPREVAFTVHAKGGGGRFALVTHGARFGTVPPREADEQVRAHFLQAMRKARDAGYRLHGAFEKGPRRIPLGKKDPRSVLFGAESARCVRAYALAGPARVKTLLRVHDEVVATSAGPDPARFCAPSGERLDIVSVGLETGTDGAWLMVLVK